MAESSAAQRDPSEHAELIATATPDERDRLRAVASDSDGRHRLMASGFNPDTILALLQGQTVPRFRSRPGEVGIQIAPAGVVFSFRATVAAGVTATVALFAPPRPYHVEQMMIPTSVLDAEWTITDILWGTRPVYAFAGPNSTNSVNVPSSPSSFHPDTYQGFSSQMWSEPVIADDENRLAVTATNLAAADRVFRVSFRTKPVVGANGGLAQRLLPAVWG
jgi:hypothetical protein